MGMHKMKKVLQDPLRMEEIGQVPLQDQREDKPHQMESGFP